METDRPVCSNCGSIESMAHGFGGSESDCARCGGVGTIPVPAKPAEPAEDEKPTPDDGS